MDFPQPQRYTVNDFQEWAGRDTLVLQPKFQRRLVWQPKARSYLLDSMLRHFPIPPIYIREILDPMRRKTVREVVDGQQRLQTILDFLDDQFVVARAHNEDVGGRTFSELPDDTKRDFLKYPFSVVLLIGADDTEVFRTFERLNSYTLPLNAQEKLNAKYFGAFKQFIFSLGQDHLEFWRQNHILSNRNITRMGEAELTGELVVAMLAGLQDKKKSLEVFYRRHDDGFPDGRRVRHAFERCVAMIQAVIGEELPESPFRKKALFYSLFCAFYDVVYGLGEQEGTTPERIAASSYSAVRRSLNRLGAVLESEAPTSRTT